MIGNGSACAAEKMSRRRGDCLGEKGAHLGCPPASQASKGISVFRKSNTKTLEAQERRVLEGGEKFPKFAMGEGSGTIGRRRVYPEQVIREKR